jgi:hypothetical protein
MANSINDMGDSTSFDMGDMGGGMGDMQTTALDSPTGDPGSTVQMFAPDDSDNMGDTQPTLAAAAQDVGGQAAPATAAQGAGGQAAQATAAPKPAAAAAPQAGGGAAGMANLMGPIMDMVKAAISAATQVAPPLLGMITSLMGGAGAAGAGKA